MAGPVDAKAQQYLWTAEDQSARMGKAPLLPLRPRRCRLAHRHPRRRPPRPLPQHTAQFSRGSQRGYRSGALAEESIEKCTVSLRVSFISLTWTCPSPEARARHAQVLQSKKRLADIYKSMNVCGPNDVLSKIYGNSALTSTRAHIGSSTRIQRVIQKAFSGQPLCKRMEVMVLVQSCRLTVFMCLTRRLSQPLRSWAAQSLRATAYTARRHILWAIHCLRKVFHTGYTAGLRKLFQMKTIR